MTELHFDEIRHTKPSVIFYLWICRWHEWLIMLYVQSDLMTLMHNVLPDPFFTRRLYFLKLLKETIRWPALVRYFEYSYTTFVIDVINTYLPFWNLHNVRTIWSVVYKTQSNIHWHMCTSHAKSVRTERVFVWRVIWHLQIFKYFFHIGILESTLNSSCMTATDIRVNIASLLRPFWTWGSYKNKV